MPTPAGLGFNINFTTPPFSDELKCHYLKTSNANPAEVKRVRVNFPPGSHHVHIYRSDTPEPDGVQPCTGGIDWTRWKLVVGAQTQPLDWSLPQGVTLPLQPNQQLLVQVHWVNTAAQPVSPTITVDLETTEVSEHHLGVAFGVTRAVYMPPHSEKTTSGFVPLPEGASIIALMGHFHERGRHYSAVLQNKGGDDPGRLVYEGQGEQTLTFKHYDEDPPMVGPNQGVSFQCKLENTTGLNVTWGANVANQEHCNVAVYYKLPGLEADGGVVVQGDVASISIPPVMAGQTATGTVTLDADAGPDDIDVYMSTVDQYSLALDSEPPVVIPAVVTVPAWSKSATFPVVGKRPKVAVVRGTTGADPANFKYVDNHVTSFKVDGLRLSEVFYDGGSPWIEVSNVSTLPINLCNYSLALGSSAFDQGTSLGFYEWVVPDPMDLTKSYQKDCYMDMLPPSGCRVYSADAPTAHGQTWTLAQGTGGGVALIPLPYFEWDPIPPEPLETFVFGSAPLMLEYADPTMPADASGARPTKQLQIQPSAPSSGAGTSLERMTTWFKQPIPTKGICRVNDAQ